MQKSREIVLSTSAGVFFLSARHASYSARIELKPRPQVQDGLPVCQTYLPGTVAFWKKVRIRRDTIENRRKITNCTYTYTCFMNSYKTRSTRDPSIISIHTQLANGELISFDEILDIS